MTATRPLDTILNDLDNSNSPLIVENSAVYKHMLRTNGTEAIRKLMGQKDQSEYKQHGTNAIVNIGEAEIIIENFYNGNIEISTIAGKLFLYLLQEVASILDRTSKDTDIILKVHLKLDLLANQFNRKMDNKSKYKFRSDIEEALNTIYHLNLTTREVLRGKSYRLGQARFISNYLQDHNNKFAYNITLNMEFVNYLKGSILMNFYQDIFKISDRTIFNIQSRFNIHYTIRNNHKPKKNNALVQANVLNITTLIDWAINIPTISDVRNSDRRITDRILEPIAKALDHQHGMIKKWQWAKQNKEPLTDHERANLSEIVEDLQIHILEVKGEVEVTEPIYASIGTEMEKREKEDAKRKLRVEKAKKVQPKKPKDE